MNIFNMGPKDDSRYGFERADAKGDEEEKAKILLANNKEAIKNDTEMEKADKQFDQDIRKFCDALRETMGTDSGSYEEMKKKMKKAVDDNMGWS